MPQKPFLHTLLSPRLLDLYDVNDSIVVIIDVFRATSTIATAFYNGAEKVIPVSGVEDCIAMGKKLNAVTAGERDGKIIEGLQHGNSPAEYPRSFIEGKTLVLTTTNGTSFYTWHLTEMRQKLLQVPFQICLLFAIILLHQTKILFLVVLPGKTALILKTLYLQALLSANKKIFYYTLRQQPDGRRHVSIALQKYFSFIRKTTHWHRLASYGLEKDLEYCVTADVANVLPVYREGALLCKS